MIGSPGELALLLQKRSRCLRALVKRPQEKRELVDELDIPRSTLDDIIRQLEEAELVEYREGVWEPTYSAELAVRAQREYLSYLDTVQRAAPVLDELDSTSEITADVVKEATVYETEPRVPDSIMTCVLDTIEDASDVKIVSPRFVTGHIQNLYNKGISGDGDSLTLVLDPEVIEMIASTYSSLYQTMVADDRVTLFSNATSRGTGLWLFDENRMGVSVFTERGVAGLLVNDTAESIEWAKDQYRLSKENARRVELPRDISTS